MSPKLLLSLALLVGAGRVVAQEEPSADDAAEAPPDGSPAAASDGAHAEPADEEAAAEARAAEASQSEAPPDAPEAAPAESGAGRVVFLVTDVEVSGADLPIDGDSARDVLATRFGRLRDKIEVRSLGEVKTSLDRAAMAEMLGGESVDLTTLPSYVDVDRIVFGRIAEVGSVIDVSVKVFNVREGSVEIALSRRLRKDSDGSLVLAALDKQADKLLSWVVETYTDGEASAAFQGLSAQKKPTRRQAEEAKADAAAAEASTTDETGSTVAAVAAPPAGGYWRMYSWLGVIGAGTLGMGVALVGVAGMLALIPQGVLNLQALPIPYVTEGTLALAGGLLAIAGIVVMAIDVWLEE